MEIVSTLVFIFTALQKNPINTNRLCIIPALITICLWIFEYVAVGFFCFVKFLIPGLKNEDSLDSFWEGAISDSKLGTIPAYVPNLMDSASKLLDKVTMNRIIHQAIPELDNDIKKVIVYYIDITDEV